MSKTYETGMEKLDNNYFNGGIKGGTMCAIVSEVDSIGDLLSYHLATTGRPTRFIANVKRKDDIKYEAQKVKEAKESEMKSSETEMDLEVIEAYGGDFEDILTKASSEFEKGDNLVVDDARRIENEKAVREIKKETRENNIITYLNMPYVNKKFDELDRGILSMCDIVIEITSERNGDSILRYMEVKKYIGGEVWEDRASLRGADKVEIDPSQTL
jgi:KaiC/GvpD/RAD55 family RecA-like ATPase